MPSERFFELKDNQWGHGVIINEYNEEYSIAVARKPNGEGTIYMEWCSPIYKGKPKEKENGEPVMIPLAIKLGNHRDAINLLQDILDELKNADRDEYEPQMVSEHDADSGDDIPF